MNQAVTQQEEIRRRRSKVSELRHLGAEPYAARVDVHHTLDEIRRIYAGLKRGQRCGETVALAGRVMTIRVEGSDSASAIIRDGSGPARRTNLLVILTAVEIGSEQLARWRRYVDPGDHIAVNGEIVGTEGGGLVLQARNWSMVSKSLRPLSDADAVRHDVERRHADLLVNDEARRMLVVRAEVLAALRRTFDRWDYLEVDTPILHRTPDDAVERPFRASMKSMTHPTHLRTSPLYMKRMLAAGFDRIFEIARSFRDEAADATHAPEYSLVEAYQAYGDYLKMQALAKELVCDAALAALGTTKLHGPRGREVDLSGDWKTKTLVEAVSEAIGTEVTPHQNRAALVDIARKRHLELDVSWSGPRVFLELYDRLVEPHTMVPTIYTSFPIGMAPFAGRHPSSSGMAEKWDLVILGREVATAYTELIDPDEQRDRLEPEAGSNAVDEALGADVEFLDVLETGLPPCGGLAIGLERLLMTITGADDISQVVAFPLATRRQ